MKIGGGRLLAAALSVAALCSSDLAHAAGELGDPAVPSSPPSAGANAQTAEWSTQHWPMHGQRGDKHRRITAEFTSARYRNGTTFTFPTPWYHPFARPTSEVVTAWSPGMSLVGPHGVWAITSSFQSRTHQNANCQSNYSGSAMVMGLTTASWNGMYFGGFTCMPVSAVSVIPAPCGFYQGAPMLIADATVLQEDIGTGTKVPLGIMHVYGVTAGCSDPANQGWTGRLQHSIMITAYAQIPLGGGLPVTVPLGEEISQESFMILGNSYYSPALADNVIYVATAREDPDNNPFGTTPNQVAGILYAVERGSFESSMTEKWSAALQLGSGSTGPLPKGQEPPPAAERFHPSTPVAVGSGLVVVGCRQWSDDTSLGYYREIVSGYRLFAFDAASGNLRFTYPVDGEILSTPAITPEFVIFGTKNGRAYAVNHSTSNPSIDGTLKWEVTWANRITYRALPFSSPQQFADAALHGPAIDAAGNYAYFGGTDGRVHRFAVAGGGLVSSPVLMYYREREAPPWGVNIPRDANGLQKIRPIRISSEPVIYRNRTLIVRTHTNTQGPDPDDGQNYGVNGAFLCALQLPDMTMNPNISTNLGAARLDAGSSVFRAGGTASGAVAVSSWASSGPLQGWDPINQISYIDDPGSVMRFEYGDEFDSGGVSMGDGFVFITDGSGEVTAFPSHDEYNPPAPSGSVTPHPPVAGPQPDPGPPALGPVEAFPNPFMPARAKGGTFKFRNLPMGTRIELYTLAFERVKTLSESGYRAEWDATNEAGQPVASGVYLYKIFFPDDQPAITGRVVLTR